MRLTPILIVEGRKEDLRKKYTEKFREYPENLDFILGISDLADTNFKYADFVLKNTNPNASSQEVEHIVDLVKDFDRFQPSLEIKDINKYDVYKLVTAIDKHREISKTQQKKPAGPTKLLPHLDPIQHGLCLEMYRQPNLHFLIFHSVQILIFQTHLLGDCSVCASYPCNPFVLVIAGHYRIF